MADWSAYAASGDGERSHEPSEQGLTGAMACHALHMRAQARQPQPAHLNLVGSLLAGCKTKDKTTPRFVTLPQSSGLAAYDLRAHGPMLNSASTLASLLL